MMNSDLGTLPRWNLDDLYATPDDPALTTDLNNLRQSCIDFQNVFNGNLAQLKAAQFLSAVEDYQSLQALFAKIGSYAQLYAALDMSDAARTRFQNGIQEQLTEISLNLLFFTLEINQLEQKQMDGWMADSPALARYRPWLNSIRAFRPHQLPEDQEKLLQEKSVTGAQAWQRLYDETLARMRFTVGEQSWTLTEVLHALSEPDGALRHKAALALGKGLDDNIALFTLITNTLAKDKAIEDKLRQFSSPMAARNLANQVEDAVVEALTAAVVRAYPRLSHRYYSLKAKWFGSETIPYWDRNAPLPDVPEILWPWEKASALVLDSLIRFSPDLAAVGQQFFDKPWIDAPATAGKYSGAFAHPTTTTAHPYLLLNYMGRSRDVMTLAHELGHGIHQVLAAPQGELLADTPLTLAETASVFGEMLTFRALLAQETDLLRRRALLASKVEDMLNTVVRQVAFHQFEQAVHNGRQQGELSAEQIGEFWMDVQRQSLGPAIRLDDDYRSWWAYIPHFIHSPFYVYAYAFGDCLVNSLYAVYQNGTIADFPTRYKAMLQAGGSLRHRDLLAPFGLDAADPAFWDQGLSMIAGLIDELETL